MNKTKNLFIAVIVIGVFVMYLAYSQWNQTKSAITITE